MIQVTVTMRILVAIEPVDLRKGYRWVGAVLPARSWREYRFDRAK
jgi:hypothetical protein